MGSPQDVAFGRAAIARGLLSQQAVRDAWSALPADRSLAHELVARRLLRPTQAQAILAQLEPAAPSDPIPLEGDDTTAAAAGAPGSGAPGPGGLPAIGHEVDGRYRLEAVLGKGGMGAVYRARDLQRGGEAVAVKVMLPHADGDAVALARFRREAEAVAQVDSHAGVVRVRAIGAAAGLPYCVLDLVEGRDLGARVKADGPLPIDEALQVTERVCRAIAHCHARGVLHRDLKPANVLVRAADGAPFVTDFGLALTSGEERLTQTGEVMGTPAYMSPEQAEGLKDEVDALTDVYALGGILYALVTGRPPFSGDRVQVLKQVFVDPPQPVTRHRPDAPADLDAVCQKALAKDKALRYPSAAALADELARLREGAPIAARPPTRWEQLRWRLRKRDRRALTQAVLAVGVPALAVVAALAWQLRAGDPLVDALRRVSPVVAASDPLLSGEASGELLRSLEGALEGREQAAGQETAGGDRSASERGQVLAFVAALWRAARAAAGRPVVEGEVATRPEQVQLLLASARAARAGQAGPLPAALRAAPAATLPDLERLLQRVALEWGGRLDVAPAADREARLLEVVHLLGWRPAGPAAPGDAPRPAPSPSQLAGAERTLQALAEGSDSVAAAAQELQGAVARARAAVAAYLGQELAWLEEQARAVYAGGGPAPPAAAYERGGWRDTAALEAADLAPVAPVRDALLAAGKAEAMTEAIDALEAAVRAAPLRRRDEVLLVERWVTHRLTFLGEAAPPLVDRTPWRRFAGLFGALLERMADHPQHQTADRWLFDLFGAIEPHLPPEAIPEAARARLFDRLAALSRELSLAIGLEPSAAQLQTLVERLALFPRLRRLPGRALGGTLRTLHERRAFEAFVQDRPWGDVFLVWYCAVAADDPADRGHRERVRRWDAHALSLAAAALGAALSPAERQALGLTGLPYADVALQRPLAPCWVPYVRLQVARRVIRGERFQARPRVEALEAAARLLERIQVLGAAGGVEPGQAADLAGRGGALLGEVAAAVAPTDPERAAALREAAVAWFRDGQELAFAFVAAALEARPPEVAGSLYYVAGSDLEHLPRYVLNVAKRRAGWLVDLGRVEEGLAVIPAARERLAREHGLRDRERAFARHQAKLALDVGAHGEATRAARLALEGLQGQAPVSRDDRRDLAGHLDQARLLLCRGLLGQGQRDEARAVLAQAQASGLIDRDEWQPLLEDLR